MMDDLRELYQEVILDHGRRPRNFGPLDAPTHQAEGHNPLCGDQVALYLEVDDDGVVQDAKFEGKGCAISIASASTLTQMVRGKTHAELSATFRQFRDLVTGHADPEAALDELDRLIAFGGVAEFPMRVKCATMPWHTLLAALAGKDRVEDFDEDDDDDR